MEYNMVFVLNSICVPETRSIIHVIVLFQSKLICYLLKAQKKQQESMFVKKCNPAEKLSIYDINASFWRP